MSKSYLVSVMERQKPIKRKKGLNLTTHKKRHFYKKRKLDIEQRCCSTPNDPLDSDTDSAGETYCSTECETYSNYDECYKCKTIASFFWHWIFRSLCSGSRKK